MKYILLLGILLCVTQCFASEEESAYCDYTKEKSQAEKLLNQTPKVVFGDGRNSTGITNSIALGVSQSLSGYLKGRLSNQIGNQDCEIYRHVNEISKHVAFDVPSLQLKYDQRRIVAIDDALISMNQLHDQEQARIDAGVSTIVVLDLIDSAAEQLRVQRAALQQQIAIIVIPEIDDTRLDQLLVEVTELENQQQQTIAHQSKFDNWDLTLSVGAGSILRESVPQAPIQPYVMLSGTYSFGTVTRNHALEKSGSAYANWMQIQALGPIQLAHQLFTQVNSARVFSETSLNSIRNYADNLRRNYDEMSKINTPDAHRFQTQLAVELASTKVELESARFNMTQMNDYLKANFKVE